MQLFGLVTQPLSLGGGGGGGEGGREVLLLGKVIIKYYRYVMILWIYN